MSAKMETRELCALISTTATALLLPLAYYRATPLENIDMLTAMALAFAGAALNFVGFVAYEVYKQAVADRAVPPLALIY